MCAKLQLIFRNRYIHEISLDLSGSESPRQRILRELRSTYLMKTRAPFIQIRIRSHACIDLSKYDDLQNIMTFWCSKRDVSWSGIFSEDFIETRELHD